jgi:hypothetical protein
VILDTLFALHRREKITITNFKSKENIAFVSFVALGDYCLTKHRYGPLFADIAPEIESWNRAKRKTNVVVSNASING